MTDMIPTARKWCSPFLAAMLLVVEVHAEKASQMAFPGSSWTEATPASQGLDGELFGEAMGYLHANAGGVGADETVVIRNGYLVWKGAAANNVHEIYSATKTFTSTVMGLLAADGALSLDDPVAKHLPSIDDRFPTYRRVTLRHLATMTAGYDGKRGDGWAFYRAGQKEKHLEHVLDYTDPGRPLFEAGTSWKYHDPQVHMLGYVLTRISGRSLEEMFRERIAKPIGMKHFSWSEYGERNGMRLNNPAGTPGINREGQNQGGIYSNALDLARYGLLLLNRGDWGGRQILEPSFVAQAGSNQVPAKHGGRGGGHYGFYWWTNGIAADGTRSWPEAPENSYAAMGAGRNAIFVLPDWNMVIVRLSTTPEGHVSKGAVPRTVWKEFFTRMSKSVLE